MTIPKARVATTSRHVGPHVLRVWYCLLKVHAQKMLLTQQTHLFPFSDNPPGACHWLPNTPTCPSMHYPAVFCSKFQPLQTYTTATLFSPGGKESISRPSPGCSHGPKALALQNLSAKSFFLLTLISNFSSSAIPCVPNLWRFVIQ